MAPARSTGFTGPPPRGSPLPCIASPVACSSLPPQLPSFVPATPPRGRWRGHGRWCHGPRVLHSDHRQAGQIHLLLAGRDCHAALLPCSSHAEPIPSSISQWSTANVAIHALSSEFLQTKPYACEPSCLSMHPTRRWMHCYKNMRSAKRAVLKEGSQLGCPNSFDSCDPCHTWKFSNAMYLEGTLPSKNSFKGDCDKEKKLNTRVLCCRSRTRSVNCYRTMSTTSSKLYIMLQERKKAGQVRENLDRFFPLEKG